MGITEQFDTLSVVEIIALAIFTLGALVSSGVGSLTVLDYGLSTQLASFQVPVIGSTAIITYATVFSVGGLVALAVAEGFDMGVWDGWSTPEQILFGATLLILVAPIFFPSVSGVVNYNQLTQVASFVISTGGAYVLGRTEYSGNSMKMS